MTPDTSFVLALAVVGCLLLLAAWGIALPIAAKRADRRYAAVVTHQRFAALAREAQRRRGERL